MPVRFEGVSEYRRNFLVPQATSDHTHFPNGGTRADIGGRGEEMEPHSPQGHVTTAGLSSAKMAITQEPAITRKRKPLDNEKKVTFTTDYAEHGSPTREDDKAMKFRAGFRRVSVPATTEYNLQYTWKKPVPEPTPVLQAEHLLNSQHLEHRGPSNYPHNEPSVDNVQRSDTEGFRDIESFEKRKTQTVSRENDDRSKHDDVIGVPCDKGSRKVKDRDAIVPTVQQKTDTHSPSKKESRARHTHSSGGKISKKKSKNHHHHHHHCSKKHKSGHVQSFVSEYKREFKVWPIPSSTIETVPTATEKEVAGSPQVLIDCSDPRLLKHKPLPTHMPIVRWGSEYSANFMSPKDFDYEGGVWRGAPHPELFMKVEGRSTQTSGSEAVDQPQSTSWFDQLLELRQRAEEYKTRAQSAQFPPYHRLRHLRDQDVDDSSTISSCVCSSRSSEQSSSNGSSPPSTTSASPPYDGDRQQALLRSNREQGHSVEQMSQRQGKKQREFFTRPSVSPTSKVLRGGKGNGRQRMKVEDIEESWDSAEISESNNKYPSQSGRDDSSTPPLTKPSPQAQKRTKTHAQVGLFGEPAEVTKSRSIPRPNAFIASSGIDGEIEGRVPTPELQKSTVQQQSRHHLDITTPAGGGILISPSKPAIADVGGHEGMSESIELPFPSTSPKYRRDMKSKAPIFPSPQRMVGNGRQDGESRKHEEQVEQSHLVSTNLSPRSVPSSSSPYHAHCVPHPPHIPHSSHTHNLLPSQHYTTHQSSHKGPTSNPMHINTKFSGPVRKLLFESNNKRPLSVSADARQQSSTSQTRHKERSKLSHSCVSHSCETCGAHLRSSHVLGGGVGALGAGRSSGLRSAPPTNLSRLHQQNVENIGSSDDALHASRQHSQRQLQQIRSKLAYHSTSPPYSDSDPQSVPPDSGLGSSSRDRRDLRSDILNHGGVGGVGRPRDVDELSLSSLSLSSCSVASDVLRKARERRDRFWTQPAHITAS